MMPSLLFDQNISFRITKKLQGYFQGCKHVSDCGLSGAKDTDIWKYAKMNGFAIVTFDSDYFDISMLQGHPPKIIWLRQGNLSTIEIANMLIDNVEQVLSFLHDGHYHAIACLELG